MKHQLLYLSILICFSGCASKEATTFVPRSIDASTLCSAITKPYMLSLQHEALYFTQKEQRGEFTAYSWPVKVLGVTGSLDYVNSPKGTITWFHATNLKELNEHIIESDGYKTSYAKFFYAPNEKDYDELNGSLTKIFGKPSTHFRPALDSTYNLPFGGYNSSWDFDSLKVTLSFYFGVDSSISLRIIREK
jgi:hypothetical protein